MIVSYSGHDFIAVFIELMRCFVQNLHVLKFNMCLYDCALTDLELEKFKNLNQN